MLESTQKHMHSDVSCRGSKDPWVSAVTYFRGFVSSEKIKLSSNNYIFSDETSRYIINRKKSVGVYGEIFVPYEHSTLPTCEIVIIRV